MVNCAYQHWKLWVDQDQVMWLTLDRHGMSVNSLNHEVFEEFAQVIVEITQQQPKAVILCSGKKKGFIAGADIKQFGQLHDTDAAFKLMRLAQVTLDKFAALTMPTIAMITGFCLGGGLEIALACRYRVAEDIPGTLIGLPEVKLGIHPGWGGTVRLPRLIGAPAAMSIMLPGAAVNARKAAKLGIVDVAVPSREIKRAAKHYALHQPAVSSPRGLKKFTNAAWVRPWLAKIFMKQLKAKVNKSHYPAPYAIVDNWVADGVSELAFITEAQSIAKLMLTDTSRSLVRDFLLQDKLKSLGKVAKFTGQHIHVIGAGTMGGDIAAWCAYKGFTVTLQDVGPESIAPAIKRAYRLYKKKLKKTRLIQAVLDRLQPDIQGHGIAKADIVIEAIFEDLEVKRKLFQAIEPKLKPGALLATNTSSIPLDELATVLEKPERLVGIHFFNPVAKMPLVEVVVGQKTASKVAQEAQAFVGKISRLPLPVTSSPGFLVNRVLMPYLMEAMQLVEEGASVQVVDQAACEFGMPMGPIALADKVGLDVCLSVAKNLTSHYGGEISPRLQAMVDKGDLGCKSGRGFYQYKNGKVVNDTQDQEHTLPDIGERLILRMLNEAVAALSEKVVANADLLDAGMIFGTGFAPFRGGPLHYVGAQGAQKIHSQLQNFAKIYGPRFEPHASWPQLIQQFASTQTSQSAALNGKISTHNDQKGQNDPVETRSN